MKKILSIVLMVVFALVFTACVKQPMAPAPKTETVTEVVIDKAVLSEFREKWPVITSVKQARALGLHETVLTELLDVINLQNKKEENPWKWETLKVETKVWSDGNGIPRYISACLNLIYVPTTTVTKVTSVAPAPVVAPLVVKKGFWVGFWGVVWDILKWVLIVLGILLLLLLLLLVLRLFRWPWRVARRLFGKDKPMPMATPIATQGLRKTPASAPKSVTPATPGKTWTIKASLNENGKIIVEGEGLKTLSTKCLSKNISIVASRR